MYRNWLVTSAWTYNAFLSREDYWTKFYTGRLRPNVHPFTPLYHTIFDRKGTYLIRKFASLLTAVNLPSLKYDKSLSQKTRTFSRLSDSHKRHLSALFGLFTDLNDRFPTLSYTSTSKIPHLFINLKPENGNPFGRSLSLWKIIATTPGGLWKKKLSRLLGRIDVTSFNTMMSLKVTTDRVSFRPAQQYFCLLIGT